ncbi:MULTISPECIES: hypothetical protein [unclassified Blastococcus]
MDDREPAWVVAMRQLATEARQRREDGVRARLRLDAARSRPAGSRPAPPPDDDDHE